MWLHPQAQVIFQNMAAFLLILLLPLSTTVSALERHTNISIGSSLSPTTGPSSWLSLSGRFAFGFYPQAGGGFAIAIWFANISQNTVVWTARQHDPLVSKNVSLILTDKGLLLQHDQDQDIYSSVIVTYQPTSSASMLDSGNFVLFNSNFDIVWQSFKSPTNTILQGQHLSSGMELFSSVSETNHSTGKFRLSMQPDGNLVQYPVGTLYAAFDAYWASDTDKQGFGVSLNLDNDGRLYLLKGTGFNIKNVTNSFSSSNVFYRMTLDVDGIFRVYSLSLLEKSGGNWSIRWASSYNKCDPKGLCGLNGLCVLPPNKEPVCKCLPGFTSIDQDQPSPNCKRNLTTHHCTSEKEHTKVTMDAFENIIWEDDPYATISPTTEEDCKTLCLEDCNCESVLLAGRSCTKQALPLRYGKVRYGGSTKAFIKMSSPIGTVLQPSNNNNGTTTAKETSKKKLQLGILFSGVTCLAFSFVILAIFCILLYRNHMILFERKNSEKLFIEEISLRSFAFVELQKATNSFKEEVGRGAFGTVFRGALSNKRIVAVKRLERLVEEGEREFLTEMRVIGKTHHKNLVRLLGYCHTGSNRLLVYDYMSNGSLADLLFKSPKHLILEERARIALDIARGILYLHEECETQIIHCDIKPSNILMDENGCAKIADFGLAKLLKPDQTKTFTVIRGTRGYLAPEWHKNLPITVKADIYSFGVVLLETICCRRSLEIERPDNEIVLAEWVYQCFENGQLRKLVIGEDEEEVDMRTLERMVSVGLWCIQDEPSLRPCMKNVVLMLEGIMHIPVPPVPTSQQHPQAN